MAQRLILRTGLAALGLGAAALAWIDHGAAAREIRVGRWQLSATSNGFTQETSCRLRRGALEVTKGALVVRIGRGVDTSRAVYRIDDGDPVRASSNAPEIATLGFALRSGDIFNPSGGVVRIPVRRTLGASRLRVQVDAARGGRPLSFGLDGLVSALTAASDFGCPPLTSGPGDEPQPASRRAVETALPRHTGSAD